MSDLLPCPCPFCGTPPTVGDDQGEPWWIGCNQCDYHISGDQAVDTLAKWNRRVDHRGPSAEVVADARYEYIINGMRHARDMVSALNKGERDWIMSIPARPFHDPDIVIATALDEAKDYIDQLRTALAAAKGKA